MTAILGISAFYHDAAAALVVDGTIVAAAQEERFSRVKHDEAFPIGAIRFCLDEAGLSPGQPDYVGNHTGLLDTSGRQKPAWNAMLEYPEGGQLPGSRGASCSLDVHPDTAPPQTAIVAPRRPAAGRKLRVRLVASESKVRFQCRLVRATRKHKRRARGAAWRSCPRRYRTPRLRSGRYRLEVRAVDARGNVDRSPALARLVLKRHRKPKVHIRVLSPNRATAARLR